jgi:23S rRNA (pseudouridine1915-N3)-methyltransferase
MAFKIFKIGKVKNDYIDKLCDYYKTLISKYSKIEIVEVASPKKIKGNLRDVEGDKLSKLIDDTAFNILLDENGREFDSVSFANFLNDRLKYGKNVNFFIAGAFGIENKYKNKFDFKLSLSKMTMPHEMAYLVLLEQLFRSMKILNNEPYNY